MEKYLVAGDFWFWLFVVAVTLGLFISVAWDAFFASLAIVGGTIAVLAGAYKLPVGDFLPHTWWGTVLWVLGYALVGGVWSTWKFYVEYKERVAIGLATRSRDRYAEWFRDHAPKVRDMKHEIVGWIAYWPVSVLLYLFTDLLKHLFEEVYRWFSGIYEGIAKRVQASFLKGVE